jgi:hypothetical protein
MKVCLGEFGTFGSIVNGQCWMLLRMTLDNCVPNLKRPAMSCWAGPNLKVISRKIQLKNMANRVFEFFLYCHISQRISKEGWTPSNRDEYSIDNFFK